MTVCCPIRTRLAQRQHAVDQADATSGRTPAGDALSELVVHVFRLDGMLKATGDKLAKPAGQTTARWRVLAAVEDEPMTVAQIARAWSLARQSVQRVADVLERDGLVTYEENPAHRRAQLVRLTPRGRSALRRIRAAQREWADALGDRIGTGDLQTASRILSRIIEAFENTA
jgi:DNA-binding MarR family transcriptional regulator